MASYTNFLLYMLYLAAIEACEASFKVLDGGSVCIEAFADYQQHTHVLSSIPAMRWGCCRGRMR
jgi:hypothetical protein